MTPSRIRTALRLVESEKVFSPRDPEEAPVWLIVLCGSIMIGIAVVTFVAIARLP